MLAAPPYTCAKTSRHAALHAHGNMTLALVSKHSRWSREFRESEVLREERESGQGNGNKRAL